MLALDKLSAKTYFHISPWLPRKRPPKVQKHILFVSTLATNTKACRMKGIDFLPTAETHGETGSVHPKMLILLFYVLKHCFLGSFWVDRPSLSVSFRNGKKPSKSSNFFKKIRNYEEKPYKLLNLGPKYMR